MGANDSKLSTPRVIARNVLSNWAGYAVNAAVSLVLTPFIVSGLGDERYGLWVLANSVLGYYGLLDMGFRAGINQFLSRYLATGDFDGVNRTASSAAFGLGLAGLLILPLSVAAGELFPAFVPGIDAVFESEIRWALALFGLGAAIDFPCFLYPAVFVATQRYDLLNAVGIASRLVLAAAVYWSLETGGGLVQLAAVTVGVNAVAALVRIPIAHALVPQLSVSWRNVNRGSIREIASYGGSTYVITLGLLLSTYSAPWVISLAAGPQALSLVAFYNLAVAPSNYLFQAINPVSQVFFPTAVRLHAHQQIEDLRKLHINGSRLVLVVSSLLISLAWAWAPEFYGIWLGAASDELMQVGSLADLARLAQFLLLSKVAFFLSGIGKETLLAVRAVRGLAIATLAEAVTFVAFGLLVTGSYGLAGVAAASVASVALCRTFVVPSLVRAAVKCPAASYFRQTLPRAVIVAAGTLLISSLIRQNMPPVDTILELGLAGAASFLFSAVVGLSVGLNRTERRRYLYDRIKLVGLGRRGQS